MRTTRHAAAAAAAVTLLVSSMATVLAPSAGASTPYPAPPAHASVSPCTPYALPVPTGWNGELLDVNDNGTYVGGVQDTSGEWHAAFWTHTGADPGTGYTMQLVDETLAPGGEFLDINAGGTATGFSGDTNQGWVYDTVTGDFHLLPDFGAGGSNVWPRRINDQGVIAGGAYTADGTEFAGTWAPSYTAAKRLFVPHEEQVYTLTDPATGEVYTWTSGSEATGVNNDGTVAIDYLQFRGGHSRRISGDGRFAHDLGNSTPYPALQSVNPPVLMTAAGRVIQLNTTGDPAYTFALGDSGIAIGDDITAWDPFSVRPVYWKGGMEHDLGMPQDATFGRALNVNGTWATGGIDYPDGSSRSYVWTGAGALQLGQPLAGYTNSWAHLVNEKLHQFGGSSDDGTTEVATIWQCPTNYSSR